MKAMSLKELNKALEAGKINEAEYRKYFGKLTGSANTSYPDFSSAYLASLKGEANASRKPKKPLYAIVKALLDTDGSMKVVEVTLFRRRKSATEFMENMEKSGNFSYRDCVTMVAAKPDQYGNVMSYFKTTASFGDE